MSKIVINDQYWKIAKVLQGLSKNAAKIAVSRSLSRTISGVAKAANQGLRARKLVNLGAKALKTNFRVDRKIGRSASVSQMYASLTISGKPLSLARFYARRISAGRSSSIMRQDKYGAWKGVKLSSVRVSVLGSSYIVERGFMIQKGKGGGKVILARLGASRLPVAKQKGPSAAELSERSGLTRTLVQLAQLRFRKEVSHEIEFQAELAIRKANGGKR